MATLQRLALGAVVLSSLLADAPARSESPAPDAGFMCSSSLDCGCGYVCTFNRCEYRGESAVPTECSSDAACRTGCFGHVCMANRCVIPVADGGLDSGTDTGVGEAPIDVVRPDVQPPRDVSMVFDVPPARDLPAIPEDRPTAAPDVADDVPADDGSDGRLVPGGCGCVAATSRASGLSWALAALLALGRRRRRVRPTA